MNESIIIKDTTKQFKSNLILNKINLSVFENEILGIVGLNGVGKTTLIKIILGLISANSGEIIINSNKIFYLPEKFTPSPLLTGIEFIEFSNEFFKRTTLKNEVQNYFEKFYIDSKYITKRIKSYSKGMGQKIGLICAFMSNADILILDEPMSGLDPLARIALKKLIKEYKEKGKTILFSSHILSDVEELCDRVTFINNGEIAFMGKTKQLLDERSVKNLDEAFFNIIQNQTTTIN